MKSYKRSTLALFSFMTLLTLCVMPSCNQPTPQPPPATTTAKEELTRALGNASLTGFEFESTETDAQVVSSFTNSNVKSLIRLERDTRNVILKYTTVKDKGKNTSTTYKTEINRSANAVEMLVTDFATGNVVSKDTFPPPTSHTPTGQTFNSLEECIRDFDCKHKGELQCEANRTCQDQFAGLTCCLTNGQCFSVHLIIRPTSLKCLLRPWVVNFEGLVLSRQ